MDEEKILLEYEKNDYLFRILYLIRVNLPSSEYLYIIMYFLKYIGFILFSVSLNEWKNNDNENDINNKNNENTFIQ
jgi:hypothetical protein